MNRHGVPFSALFPLILLLIWVNIGATTHHLLPKMETYNDLRLDVFTARRPTETSSGHVDMLEGMVGWCDGSV